MNRTCTSGWARISLAAGAAVLLALSAPVTARAATGSVAVTVMPDGRNITMNDPANGHCYTVQELAPGSAGKFFAMTNNTDEAFYLYGDSSCGSSSHLLIGPGGKLMNWNFASFQLS